MIRYKTYSAIRPVSGEVIADAFKDSEGRDIIFVAPEFSKAQVEREVLAYKESHFDEKGSIDTGDGVLTLSSSLVSGDVISFRKLAGNILDDLGTNYVAEGGEIMLRNAIYNILARNKDELKAFGTLSSRIDYINMMIALLGDFSRYGVGIEEIGKAIEALDNNTVSQAFLMKLKDLHFIMSELEAMNVEYGLNLLREPISLACDRLSSEMSGGTYKRRRSGLDSLKNSKIVFVGFGATRMLTPKEIRLVSLLSDFGCDIVFNLLAGTDGANYSSVYKTGEDFKAVLDGLGARGEALPSLGSANAMDSLAYGFATDSKQDYPELEGRIRLAELSGIDDRVGYVFSEIIDLTRNHGYRYRDIRIVCCNEDITARMRSTAELYGLDVFIDRKIALGGTVVPYMMQTLLELPERNYQLDLVMKAMRSGMLQIAPYIADSFENYCFAKNITDAGRLFDESAYTDNDDGKKLWIMKGTVPGYEEGFTDAGRFFYDYVVVRSLIPLKDACRKIKEEKTISGKARMSLDYLGTMKSFIEALRDEFIDKGHNTDAVALVRGYDELMSLLLSCTHKMNDCPIKQKDFLSMIRTDMRNRTEGTIPLKVDSIEITTPEHAFVTPCKVLFIIGAQKDNFPYIRMREGLLSGNELKVLSDSHDDIRLPDKAESKMREEFVTACLDIGAATDMIYMVHEYGKPKSRIFEYFEDVEKSFKQKHHIVNTFKNPICGEPVKFRHGCENDGIPKDIMSRLLTRKKDDGKYGKVIYASVSSIEKYRACAFQYMLERVLYIKEREDKTSIQANSFGTLIHSMFENAYRDLRDRSNRDPEKFKELASALISDQTSFDSFMEKCLKESISTESKYGLTDKDGNPKDKVFEMNTCSKLRRMFSQMFLTVLQDSVDTGFVPEGLEEHIGGENLTLNIPYDGIDLNFTGFIDRYDVRTDENGKVHIRTIDYKSGDKSVKTNELLIGTQIQLPAYSGAILDKYGENASVDDYGYVLLGLKPDKNGNRPDCTPKLSDYDPDSIDIAVRYAKHVIKESVDQIAEGKADAIVGSSHISPCDYCKFKGYCGNNPVSPKCRPDIDLGAGSKYAEMAAKEEQASGKSKMKKADKAAIYAMKDKLEKSGEKEV